MTSIKCVRCQKYWTMNTLHPEGFRVINRFCPDCVPLFIPQMGVAPLPRRIA